jgi:hypothetical protein
LLQYHFVNSCYYFLRYWCPIQNVIVHAYILNCLPYLFLQ